MKRILIALFLFAALACEAASPSFQQVTNIIIDVASNGIITKIVVNGRVGINTNLPQFALHIRGSALVVSNLNVGGAATNASLTSGVITNQTDLWIGNYRTLHRTGSTLNLIGTNGAAGDLNTFAGDGNFLALTNGNQNSGLGYRNFYALTSGNQNSGLGYQNFYAMANGNQNSGLGYRNFYALTSGNYNSGLGYRNFYALTSGNHNSGLGAQNFYALTSGNYNCAIGNLNGTNITSGSGNFFFGIQAQNPFSASSGILNLGNLLFATGMVASASSPQYGPSGGWVGINSTNADNAGLSIGGILKVTGAATNASETTGLLTLPSATSYIKYANSGASNPPTTGAGTAWIFSATNGGTLELYTKDGAGNITLISPHAGDAPDSLVDSTDEMPWVSKELNVYTGKARWVNFSRLARRTEQLEQAVQFLMSQVNTNGLGLAVRQKIQQVLDLTSDQMEIVHVVDDYATPVSWTDVQNQLQAEYALGYTNSLLQYESDFSGFTNALQQWIDAGDTNVPPPVEPSAPVWSPPPIQPIPQRLYDRGVR